MAIYAVMIRLQSGDDYSKRLAETVAVIHNEGGGSSEVWEEPTSTYILRSNKATQNLCDSIYLASPIYESKDLLVVVNLSMKAYAQKGAKYPNTLKSLMDGR